MLSENTITTNSIKAWILAARPKTLSGAAVPVMIGCALAYADSMSFGDDIFSFPAAILCMLFAFIMQIDANFINDFIDFAKGTDDCETRLGPKRACAQGWVTPQAMKHAIAATTILACLVGLPLVFYGGLEMILIGMICVVFCFLYTTHLSYMGLGDLLVLVFFGLVPVCITYYIQLHEFTLELVVASLACGLVIDTLLLINNFRDRETDKVAGKNTLAVCLGAKNTHQLYLGVGVAANLLGAIFWVEGHVLAFILPFFYLALHYLTWLHIKSIWEGRELNKCLGETARNMFVYGLLVTVGILLS